MPILNNHITVPVKLKPAVYAALRSIADQKGCQVHHLLEHLAERSTNPATDQRQAGDRGIRTTQPLRHPQVRAGDPLLDDLRDLVAQGRTDWQIADQLHLTREHAAQLRRRLKLKPNHPSTQADQQRLELYNQGLTDQQIADRLHMTRAAICVWRGRKQLPPHTTRKGHA